MIDGIAGSNPAEDMDVCLLCLLCFVWVATFVKFLSLIQGSPSVFVHSHRILSDDRSKASSKTVPPYSAI